VLVDAEGIPLGSIGTPANRHHSISLTETLHAVVENLEALTEPGRVHLSRGYDSDLTRNCLAERNLIDVICQKGKP
jgi:hypothetical protein